MGYSPWGHRVGHNVATEHIHMTGWKECVQEKGKKPCIVLCYSSQRTFFPPFCEALQIKLSSKRILTELGCASRYTTPPSKRKTEAAADSQAGSERSMAAVATEEEEMML